MIVRRLRDKRNWSQEQLATIAGLSLRTIQRVEAGNNASMETLKSLASVFDVDISTLTEEITVIDKNSASWKAEPWIVRFFLLDVKRRTHMVYLEYGLLLIGVVSWLMFTPLAITTPLAFLCAYLNARLIAYLDHKGHW
jgi:transcriptional regulator with XRE-family HTH domain